MSESKQAAENDGKPRGHFQEGRDSCSECMSRLIDYASDGPRCWECGAPLPGHPAYSPALPADQTPDAAAADVAMGGE